MQAPMASPKRRPESLGQYRLVRKLGTGGMAEVFLASQRMEAEVVRPVVIKAILPHLAEDERFVQMFMREARVAAMLSHPNIVHIHDVATLDGRPCIIMEFLKGRDLWMVMQRLVTAGEKVPPKYAAAIIGQAAAALDYAHRKLDRHGSPLDLVHRDISPHNLFITRDGIVKVLDFGIAKSAYQQDRTASGVIKGKLPYMSPEQARGKDVDHRTDQFALGVVMWEMLTGERLFARDDALQTMTAMFHEPIPPPSSRAEIPEQLENICLRCLERSPTDRFDSCESLAHHCRGWLASESSDSEAKLTRRLLAQAIPVSEDEEFYAPDAQSQRAGVPSEELNVVGRELTPSHSGIVDRPRRRADGRPAAPTLTPPTQKRRADRRRMIVMGSVGALGLAAFLVTAIVLTGSSSREPQTEELPGEDPPTEVATPPSAPEPIRVAFVGVPDAVDIEVDGEVLEEPALETMPSDDRHFVRALYDGRELWRYDALWQEDTEVELPELILPESPPVETPMTTVMRTAPRTMRSTMRAGMRSTMRGGLGMGIVTDYP